MTLEHIPFRGQECLVMLQHMAENMATRLGIDDQARWLRNTLYPAYRRNHIDNLHLRLLLTFTLKDNSNCIDVGAYRGEELAEMVRIAPRGTHIAYEPLPFMYTYLVQKFPTVHVRNAALSNEEGESDFAYFRHKPGHSGFSERAYAYQSQIETIPVQTETLDKSLPTDYAPDFIKIDVEGAERLVIEGAIQTISRYRPLVAFEHGKGGAEYYDTQPRHVYNLLNNEARLRIFDLDGNGPYTLDQFEETYAQGTYFNFIACPQ
jgi:FkbM family methyltransferase